MKNCDIKLKNYFYNILQFPMENSSKIKVKTKRSRISKKIHLNNNVKPENEQDSNVSVIHQDFRQKEKSQAQEIQNKVEDNTPQLEKNQNLQKLRQYLNHFRVSKIYANVYIFFVLLMSSSFFIYSYQHRLTQKIVDNHQINQISLIIEVVCNAFFTIHIIIKFIARSEDMTSLIKDMWFLIQIIVVASSYIGLFNFHGVQYIKALRCIRTITLIYIMKSLRAPAQAFLKSISSMRKIFIPLIILILVQSIIGLFAFKDYEFNRCREQSNLQLKSHWTYEESITYLCGTIECPSSQNLKLLCLNPIDYNVEPNIEETETEMFGYGLLQYKNYGYSLMNTFKIIFITGWTKTSGLMKNSISQSFVFIFHLTILLLGTYILSNILLAILLQGYLFQSSIKSHGKNARLSIQSNYMGNQFNQMIDQVVQDIVTDQDTDNFWSNLKNNNRYYQVLSHIFIIATCINLLLQFKNQSMNMVYIVNILDLIFHIEFIIEVAINLLERKRKYFRSDINIFEFGLFIICNVGVIYELSIGYTFYHINSIALILRTFKYFRLFILFYKSKIFEQTKQIVKCLFFTLQSLFRLIIIWLILVLLFSIVGYILFSYKTMIHEQKLDLVHGDSPQVSYDGIYNSIIYTFLIFYNEKWDEFMSQQYLGNGIIAIFWHLHAVLIGQYLFIRLFMALFLDNFMKKLSMIDKQSLKENSSDSMSQKKRTIILENVIFQKQSIQNKKPQNEIVIFKNKINIQNNFCQQIKQKKITQISEIDEQQRKKTVLFQQQDQFTKKLRLYISKILNSYFFKFFIHVLIILSFVRFIYDVPLTDPNSNTRKYWNICDDIINVFFIIEFILNLLHYGFIMGQQSYLRRSWMNLINLFVIICTLTSYMQLNIDSTILDKCKVFRLFSFIKLQQDRDINMHLTLKSFKILVPKLLKLLTFMLVSFMFFAIILVKLYKQDSFQCFNMLGTVVNKQDCLDLGGDWVQHTFNVDNPIEALIHLFFVASSQGWLTEISTLINATGQDLQPIANYQQYLKIFFIIFFFLGNICILNMFVGVTAETFMRVKQQQQYGSNLTNQQKQWYKIKQSIHLLIPQKLDKEPQSGIRKYIFQIYKSPYFQLINGIIYLAFLIINALRYTNMDHNQQKLIQICNYVYTIMIFLSLMLQFIALGRNCINSIRFQHEIIIIIYSVIWNILLLTCLFEKQTIRIYGSLCLALQISIIYKYLTQIQYIKKLLSSLIVVVPKTINILLIIIVVLFIYTIIGMQLFSYLKSGQILNEHKINYKTFDSAIFALVQFATLQQAMAQIKDAAAQIQPNFICFNIASYTDYVAYGNGCGSKLAAYFYFISYHIIFSLILITMFVAIVLDAYKQAYQSEESAVNKFQLTQILGLWKKFDPDATGFITYRDFWTFTAQIAPIYGITGKQLLSSYNKKQFLTNLNIKIYENLQTNILCYEFHDVIECLSRVTMETKFPNIILQPKHIKIHKKLHKHDLAHLKATQYHSSDMLTIIFLKSGLRKWKNKAMGINGVNDMGSIIQFHKKHQSAI